MGFASGFAQGFMNTVSSGIENENKNRLEKERDFDRIATTNIFETAREFQKENARVTSDLKKKAERFHSFLPIVNGNEAAAEALANSDTHTSDLDKISEMYSKFATTQGYKSNLPQQMQEQLKRQQDLTRGAIDRANGMIPKSSKATPFDHPDYSPMEVRPSTLPPQIPGASNKVTGSIIQHIVTNSKSYDDINEAVTAYKLQLKAVAPHAPMPSDQEIVGMFQGMKFGGAGRPDPAEQRRIDMATQYYIKEGLSPEEAKHKAVGAFIGAQPKMDPTSNESLKKSFLPLVDPIIAAFGKATYTQNQYGEGQMTFPGNMKEGDQEKLIKARGYAIGAFKKDMQDKKPSRDATEYAYWGLRRSGYWNEEKYKYEMEALEAANVGAAEPARPVNPKKPGAKTTPTVSKIAPAQSSNAPAQPAKRFEYDPNANSLVPSP